MSVGFPPSLPNITDTISATSIVVTASASTRVPKGSPTRCATTSAWCTAATTAPASPAAQSAPSRAPNGSSIAAASSASASGGTIRGQRVISSSTKDAMVVAEPPRYRRLGRARGRPARPPRPRAADRRATALRLEDRVQVLGRGGLAQLLQRARLELADPLAREAERLPDLLERVLLLAPEAVAQAQDQLLARGERADQVAHPRAHALRVEAVVGLRRGGIGDEVLEPLLGAGDRRLERDRLPREQVEDLERARVGAELGGELGGRRLAAELPGELRAHALAALEAVVHVRGQPDRARVVLDRAHQGLPDPPHGVGRELEAAPVVELLHRPDQAQVALLDQVREGRSEERRVG